MSIIKPCVFWGQDRENVFLKVDISEIQNKPKVNITDEKLIFEAEGVGARGLNNYAFSIEFYLPVISKESSYKNTGRCVQIILKKEGSGEKWPRLIESSDRVSWIKIDFDRFAFDTSDESAPDDANDISQMNYNNIMNESGNSKFAEFNDDDFEIPDYKTCYLFLYNLFQFVGFLYIIIVIGIRSVRDGLDSRAGTFKAVGPQLMFCQLIAFLEILHSFLGWVKSSTFTTIIQVVGRAYVIFILVGFEPKMHEKEVLWGLFISWSAIEIIRYPYYIFAILKKEFGILTWLRYSVWILFYPLGFLFEGLVMIIALPIFEESGKFDILMPNNFNFSFQFVLFMKIYMVFMLPGMYILMQRLYIQRKKKLGIKSKSDKAK